jgi:N-acetylmuramoyl-L-alanine amidase
MQNDALRSKRKRPNVLLPGDEVLIPEKRLKAYSGATEHRHRFVKKGTPAKFRLILERNDQPIKNTHYVLHVDGKVFEGTTNDQGRLEVFINPDASRGRLTIDDLVYELKFGGIDPHDEISGVQDRLQNLGFYHGAVDGILGPLTKEAIGDFQSVVGLEATGELDDATHDQLFGYQDEEHEPMTQVEAATPEEEPAASATTESPEASSEGSDESDAAESLDDAAEESEMPIPDDTSDR